MDATQAPELPPGALTDDRRGTIVGVVIFLCLWSTLMVALRFWTRGVIIKQLGIDDYLCAIGLLTVYGTGIAVGHMTKYGLGRHIYVMELENIPLYLRDFYVSIVMYCSGLMFLKMTFLFQYYRVLAVQHMRIVYLVSMFIVGGWAFSQVMVGIFTCNPISGFWDQTIEAKCIPNIPQWYINAAGNIITDVAVFCLPLPALWKLQLAKSSRLMLIGIFSLGFFTVIVSIVRIRYLKMFDDFPWENVEPGLWSVAELTSAVTCACLPTMRPLLARFFPNLNSSLGRSNKGAYGYNMSGSGTGGRGTVSGNNPSALESQASRTRRDRKMAEESSVSVNGSDVELSPTSAAAKDGLRANPFEVHVVHEVSMGVERGSTVVRGGFGVTGFAEPNSQGRSGEKAAWGR